MVGVLVDTAGLPVVGAAIEAGGVTTTTGSDGSYSLDNVPRETNEVKVKINGQELATVVPPVANDVQYNFSVNVEENELILESEAAVPTPTVAPTPTRAPAAPTPSPTPTATPTPISTAISLASNGTVFHSNETATFTITAAAGALSPINGESIILVVGTFGTGQTSITFSNNQTAQFPTAPDDIFYTLSLQNFVQTMQDGMVNFQFPTGFIFESTELFARALAVDPQTNALLSESNQILIQLLP